MAIPSRHRAVVNGLRIFWVLAILWYELGIFSASVRWCNWPDPYLHLPAHILLVADPQIVDRHSYSSRGPLLSYLTRVLVDLNLRKNWRILSYFLGDMMDNGRYAMPEEEYEDYYQRFSDIFRVTDGIPVYFIAGNHDTGLGISSQFSDEARSRYSAHFGTPNKVISIANHSLHKYCKELHLMFLKEQHTDPVILFSHIPLNRPDGKGCGPLREKGSIRPGVGLGYQNMLEKKSSQRLLESFKPVAVFSGDDHDYCEHTHQLLSPRGQPQMVREVTVKTISMVMNVQRPGFQLLSLAPSDLRTDSKHTYFDTPCLLPDQLRIYLNTYIPFLALSLLVVFGMNVQNETRSSHLKNRPISSQDFPMIDRHPDIEDPSIGSSSSPGWFILEGQRRRPKVDRLPVSEWFKRPKEALLCFCSGRTRTVLRRQSWLWASLLDVWSIAIFPLCTFALVTWWLMSN
ncbi:Metallo-dependent phosphatase-like protein [Gymnopilus junonius]|uniref:Metallo-dependent phosphatase-like protein n=1 Tax=Gymnopilus junonius TaxID=109634 RepID=A0A9P5NL59_GYMJU|nr:Metallo-dependent phosphatase-like protein [Gymnopilus junonius]